MKPFVNLVFLGLFAALMLSPLVTTPAIAASSVQIDGKVADNSGPTVVQGSASDSDIWRAIKNGERGNVSIPDKKSGVMINTTGENWRIFRASDLPFWGGISVGFSLLAVFIFYVTYGKFTLHKARTGRVIPRFSQAERWVHWLVASLFILLGLSGLVILFGSTVLKPLIGAEGFSTVANASLQAHNLLGPIFVAALAIMLILYFKDNLFQKGDFVWAIKGGFFSSEHPPSWKYNLGEKTWYWLLAIAGTALSLSGVFLIFPTLLTDIQALQLSQVVHAIAAVALITASIGHIYLGVWGVEGALDSMTLGYVDETWGKEHHRWWADSEIQNGNLVEDVPEAILAAKASEDA